MKTRIAIIMLMLITANINAQNGKSGNSEMRKTDSFRYINISGEMKVKLIQSIEPMVVVDGSKFQIDNTITMLKSDTLFVYQSNVKVSGRKVKVMIYASEINYLDVKGKTVVDATEFNKKIVNVSTKDGAQIKLKSQAHDKSMVEEEASLDQVINFAKWTPVKSNISIE